MTRLRWRQGPCVLLLGLALGLCVLAGARSARAQAAPRQGFRLERYGAPPTAEDGFALVLPGTLQHLQAGAHVVTHYALSPLTVPGATDRTLVKHRVTLDAAVALGLFDVLELYARLPMVLASRGESALYELTRFEPPDSPALADMAVGVAGSLPEFSGVTLGARLSAILPTGSPSALAGDRAVEPQGELMASYHTGRITAAGTLGAIVRPSSTFAQAHTGPEFHWGALLRVRLDHALEASIEALGTRALEAREQVDASDGLELFVGARRRVAFDEVDLLLGLAISAGLSDMVGEPAFRSLLSVGITRRKITREKRGEPLPDHDGDGVPDLDDTCPAQLEDRDGTEDQDGCIDPDDDGDGVLDTDDACPRVAAPGRNGCPTDDLDEDHVPDARDACPRDAEDVDGDRDEDGCPDRDSDGDGLTDDRDACPDVKGLAEKQGCLAHAQLERGRLVLAEPIAFDVENLSLLAQSGPVLDDVATLLNARTALHAVITVTLARRPAGDGGKTAGLARAMLIVEALVARGVSRARISTAVDLRAPGTTDRVDLSVRAEVPVPRADAVP